MDFTEQYLEAISSLSIDDDKWIPSLSVLLFAIVDDDDISLIYNTLLAAGRKKGFNVEIGIAKNWKEALDFFDKKHHDIIFIDMEMPSMDLWWKADDDDDEDTWVIDKETPILNAIEVPKLLHKMDDSMIVGVTSYNNDKEIEEFLEAGLDLCFQKPLSPAMVATVLDCYDLDEDEDKVYDSSDEGEYKHYDSDEDEDEDEE